MKFEETTVFNFLGAFRGLRNPFESWSKSDSHYAEEKVGDMTLRNEDNFIIGPNDMKLAQSLIKGGSEHRKFLRDITVSVDITAPRYWWQEMATYKVDTNSNSVSTMHRLMSRPLTLEDFETDDDSNDDFKIALNDVINVINELISAYEECEDKAQIFRNIKQLLPESYLQKRTCRFNYEGIRNMYFQRRSHKLREWSHDFVKWVESLPHSKELIMLEATNVARTS